MKKKLAESLRHMQSHPTTGTPHNQQVISTQVESIFMLDELRKEIKKLNKTIKESDDQSKKLELSNYKLQWAMLVLTFIGVVIGAYPVLSQLLSSITPYISQLLNFESTVQFTTVLSSLLSALLALVTTFYSQRYYEKRLGDSIKLRDSVEVLLKDEEGKIKEKRDR